MKFLLLAAILLRLPYRHYGKGELSFLLILIFGLVGVFVYAFIRDAFRKPNRVPTNNVASHKNEPIDSTIIQSTEPLDNVNRANRFFESFDKNIYYNTIAHPLNQIEQDKVTLIKRNYLGVWETSKEWETADAGFVSFVVDNYNVKVFFENITPNHPSVFHRLADNAFACLIKGPIQSNKYLIGDIISPTKWTTSFPTKKWMSNKVDLEWTLWTSSSEFSLYARVI